MIAKLNAALTGMRSLGSIIYKRLASATRGSSHSVLNRSRFRICALFIELAFPPNFSVEPPAEWPASCILYSNAPHAAGTNAKNPGARLERSRAELVLVSFGALDSGCDLLAFFPHRHNIVHGVEHPIHRGAGAGLLRKCLHEVRQHSVMGKSVRLEVVRLAAHREPL